MSIEVIAEKLRALCDQADADEIVRLLNELRGMRGDFAGKEKLYASIRKYMAQVLLMKATKEAGV